MLKKYIKDDCVIRATEKAYNVIYKYKGYKPYEEVIEEESEEIIEEIDLESLKVEELKELAKEREIEGYSKMKKEELIKVLTE